MYQGVFTAIATPLDKDGRVSLSQVGSLIHHHEKEGVHGFFVGGTGGEGILLSVEERKMLLAEFMRVKEKGTKIIVHCSAFVEGDILPLMEHAKKMGADGVALLPPGYFSPLDDEAVFKYFQRICAAIELPVMIYHLPAYSHFRISYTLFDRLMGIENLIGIKDSNGDVHQIYQFVKHVKNPIVLNGIDSVHLAALLNGVAGMISAPANIMPEIYVDLWNAFVAKDLEKAALAQQRINEVLTEIYKYPFVPALKQVLEWQGLSVGGPKTPTRPLSMLEKDTFLKGLKRLKFL